MPGLAATPLSGTVTDIPPGAPAVARDASGGLTLSFTGNRVVAISGGAGQGGADVLLDGQPMSGLREPWAASRPSIAPQMWMPAVMQIGFEKAPLAEDWTLTCLSDSSSDGRRVHFKVGGSKTGEDGRGFSDRRFVSKSGA